MSTLQKLISNIKLVRPAMIGGVNGGVLSEPCGDLRPLRDGDGMVAVVVRMRGGEHSHVQLAYCL